MSNNVTLPGTGAVVETLDVGAGVERQVITIAPRDLSGADSIGALTEAVPASDTASSGLNGRLQRIAQRLTSLMADGGLATIGTKADAKSVATDATVVSAMSVWKQISASIQAAATLLAGTLITAPAAGENHIGEVGGNTVVAGGSITRQANTTAYASGQHIAAASAAAIPCAVARKNAGTGVIAGVRISKSGTSLTNASFRVHLFKTAPGTLPADAATFAGGVSGVAAVALGYVDITMDQQYSDGAKGFASIQAKAFDAAAGSQNIYALIEARAAYTPVSAEVFTVALEALRD